MNKIITVTFLILGVFLISGCITGQITRLNCKDVQVPYDYVEEYQETVPYTDRECETKILVYSITDFVFGSSICNNRVEECRDYILGICISKIAYCTDRTVTCSLKVNNLDDERGNWVIDFKFFKADSNSIDTIDTVSTWLYPHTSGIVTGRGKIISKELFDTSYTCSYSISNEPTKEVCREVIKYKEVTKTRTVTRYRTEQKCE